MAGFGCLRGSIMAMRVKPDTGEVGLKQRYQVTRASPLGMHTPKRSLLQFFIQPPSSQISATKPLLFCMFMFPLCSAKPPAGYLRHCPQRKTVEG
ncbi:hypothetical protein ACCAA_1390009 [Candidatus Accumulibacter aalborgensis]|uniref:Uncharacterized protein n=1 Tax=Candidatus Accumulibacter aalborgensis TaxID=1860102 RepID=A0A1A8XIC0_9PROT|nr:hypothetical protein ACCAA_1390009 [Candidatus Accumulibacter aalborgensis]